MDVIPQSHKKLSTLTGNLDLSGTIKKSKVKSLMLQIGNKTFGSGSYIELILKNEHGVETLHQRTDLRVLAQDSDINNGVGVYGLDDSIYPIPVEIEVEADVDGDDDLNYEIHLVEPTATDKSQSLEVVILEDLNLVHNPIKYIVEKSQNENFKDVERLLVVGQWSKDSDGTFVMDIPEVPTYPIHIQNVIGLNLLRANMDIFDGSEYLGLIELYSDDDGTLEDVTAKYNGDSDFGYYIVVTRLDQGEKASKSTIKNVERKIRKVTHMRMNKPRKYSSLKRKGRIISIGTLRQMRAGMTSKSSRFQRR